MPPSNEPLTPEQDGLVRSNGELVRKVIKQLPRSTRAMMSDAALESEGREGMIQAVQPFDAARGVPLHSHARRRIKGQIQNAARKERGVCADLKRAGRLAGDDYLHGPSRSLGSRRFLYQPNTLFNLRMM